MAEQVKKFFELDLKSLIPVILFLVTQMIVGAAWINRIDTRLTVREASAEMALKRLEKLELERDQIIRITERLNNMQTLIEQIYKKLDQQK